MEPKEIKDFKRSFLELFVWFWLSKISSPTAFISMIHLLLPVPVSMYNLIFISSIMESIIKKTSVSGALTKISSYERHIECEEESLCQPLDDCWLAHGSFLWYFGLSLIPLVDVTYSFMFPSKSSTDFHLLTMNCINLFLFEFDDSKRFHCIIWDVGKIWLSISSPWLLWFLSTSLTSILLAFLTILIILLGNFSANSLYVRPDALSCLTAKYHWLCCLL